MKPLKTEALSEKTGKLKEIELKTEELNGI